MRKQHWCALSLLFSLCLSLSVMLTRILNLFLFLSHCVTIRCSVTLCRPLQDLLIIITFIVMFLLAQIADYEIGKGLHTPPPDSYCRCLCVSPLPQPSLVTKSWPKLNVLSDALYEERKAHQQNAPLLLPAAALAKTCICVNNKHKCK